MSNLGPLFMTGVYRSGTTLPMKILNTHSKINLTHDTVNFYRYYLDRGYDFAKDYPEIVKDIAFRLGSRFEINVPEEKIIDILKNTEKVDLAEVYRRTMIETFSNGNESVIWGEKTLLQWENIPLFLTMFPNSKAILILRDPRNTLASYRDFTIEKGMRYMDSVFACQHAFKWAAGIGKNIDSSRFRVYYHEQLVADPEKWSKDVSEFLGVEHESDMVNPEKYVDHTGKPWKSNSSFSDVKKGFSKETTQRWKNKLDPEEILFVESIMGGLMEEHGYELSGQTIGAADLEKLWYYLSETPLLQKRLYNWLDTGWGVSEYPSDPVKPQNWSKTMLPKDRTE